MSTTSVSSRLRMIAAPTAAATAIAICIAQRHVRVVLAEPDTYASPFHHKCGLLMVGCIIWAMLELARFWREPGRNRWLRVSVDGRLKLGRR